MEDPQLESFAQLLDSMTMAHLTEVSKLATKAIRKVQMENILATDATEHLKTRSFSFVTRLVMTRKNLLSVWNVAKNLPKLAY